MLCQRTLSPVHHILTVFALLALLSVAAAPALAALLPPPTIGLVEITNVGSSTMDISWVTDVATTGTARCYDAGNNLVQTAYDPINSTTTHYTMIVGLTAGTSYWCEVESGGVINDNHGARYAVTTGATLSPGAPESVFGQVFLQGTSDPAIGAIVYLRLKDANSQGTPGSSQWVSGRVDGDGWWIIDLKSVRTTDATAYFSYTPGTDQLEYWVQGGANGTWGRDAGLEAVITIPPDLSEPAQLTDAELNGSPMPLAVTLNSFAASGQTDGILVTWETTSEVDAQGFNLYRATTPAAAQELLGFVPAQAPGSTAGAAYQWLDSAVTAGAPYYYWLEAIDLAGATSLHGPVSATMQTPTAVTLTSVSASPAAASALPWLWAAAASAGAALVLTRRRR